MKIIASVPFQFSIQRELELNKIPFIRERSFLFVSLPPVYGAFEIPEPFVNSKFAKSTFFLIQEYEKGGAKNAHIVCGASSGKKLPCRKVLLEKKQAIFRVRNSLATVSVFRERIIVQKHWIDVIGDRAWIHSRILWNNSGFLPPWLATYYAATDAAKQKAKDGGSKIYFGVVK